MKTTSVRGAARSLGVALSSLQEAIKSGRVTATSDGKIADVAEARREWLAHTSQQGPSPLAQRSTEPDAGMESYNEARRRLALANAQIKELALGVEEGKYTLAADVSRVMFNDYRQTRDRLLSIPTFFKQACPHIALADLVILENLVRESLMSLVREAKS